MSPGHTRTPALNSSLGSRIVDVAPQEVYLYLHILFLSRTVVSLNTQDLGALLRRLCSSFTTSAKASSSPERCS